ncbi:hypothetical protein ACR6C2_13465 [Streptomyces sp. INA 01156]
MARPAPDAAEFAALADQTGRHHLRAVLARVSTRAFALVAASAVAAGHFSFHQVCELAGISVPDGEQARTEPAVTGLLDSAVRPRLYDPLVAERALGLLDGDRRRELHERAVRLAHREGFPQDVLGRLVVRTSLDEPWVPGALHAAGVAARRSGDDDAAVVFLERSLDHGAADGLRTDVLLELAKAQSSRRPAAERGFRRILREAGVRTGPGPCCSPPTCWRCAPGRRGGGAQRDGGADDVEGGATHAARPARAGRGNLPAGSAPTPDASSPACGTTGRRRSSTRPGPLSGPGGTVWPGRGSARPADWPGPC